MRLVKVEQSRAANTLFEAFKLGPWELGHCVAPRPNPAHGFCNNLVRDDGTGYANLDGAPFQAYVCRECAPRLTAEAMGC